MKTPAAMPPAVKQYYSIGSICQILQLVPAVVLGIANECGVEPHEWRDGVPHFRGDALETILNRVNRARAAIADAAAKADSAPAN